jgi:L-lactate dehydrogenase (cytochrome)
MRPRVAWRVLKPSRLSSHNFGVTLERCHDIDDLAAAFRHRVPRAVRDYVDGGGFGEYTMRANRRAFDEVEVVPRALRRVDRIDTSTTMIGSPSALPIALAPVGAAGLVRHDAELFAARAAQAEGIPYCLSSLASTPLEEVAAERREGCWMQLYATGDRRADAEMIQRVSDAGFAVLVITADCTVRSKRERELRSGLTLPDPTVTFTTLLDGALHPRWSFDFLRHPLPSFPNTSNVAHRPGEQWPEIGTLFRGLVDWDHLAWVREQWRRPLAVKGVLRAEDAKRAADIGVDAVIVSNHGGRQLDHAPPTLAVLPEISAAIGDRVDVLMDSGIRRGSDILVALALGARGVLVGRAYLYGLGAGGEAGVRRAIALLRDELRTSMALSGARKVNEVTGDLVRPATHCWSCDGAVVSARTTRCR